VVWLLRGRLRGLVPLVLCDLCGPREGWDAGLRMTALIEFRAAQGDGADTPLDFVLHSGDALVLSGSGASGKSRALSWCLGNAVPAFGQVRVFGCDSSRLPSEERERLRQRIGYVPQHGGLLHNLSLYDNIALPVRWHRRLGPAAGLETVAAAYEWMGLPLPDDGPVTSAPALVRQIAALARALLFAPELLLLDEPDSGLDEASADELWRLLWRVNAEAGMTMLATATSETLARPLTDRFIRLRSRESLSFRVVAGAHAVPFHQTRSSAR
jgi:ABC-type transporter Mla maintaining outer membrane lipid asymmetry ATPase subunit MlaF